MAKALLYPGADRSRWFGDNFDGRIFTDLDKLLLHSTETDKRGGCPGYSNGAVAPTLTINPWPGYRKIWQHFNLNESARALMNPSSTAVSENKDNVCQIEIIGYSDKGYGLARGCYLPDLDAESRQWLANVFAFIMREWTIPNNWATPFPWPLYPASYGNTTSRMTSAEYDAFTGVLGHLHASGNDHGDPSLPVADLKARVAALLNTTEDEVTPQDIQAVVDGVLGAKVIPANMLVPGWKEGDPVNLIAIPRFGDLVMRWSLEARDNSIVARQLAEAAALKGEALTPEEVDAIAAKVGERIAAGFDVVLEPKGGTP